MEGKTNQLFPNGARHTFCFVNLFICLSVCRFVCLFVFLDPGTVGLCGGQDQSVVPNGARHDRENIIPDP